MHIISPLHSQISRINQPMVLGCLKKTHEGHGAASHLEATKDLLQQLGFGQSLSSWPGLIYPRFLGLSQRDPWRTWSCIIWRLRRTCYNDLVWSIVIRRTPSHFLFLLLSSIYLSVAEDTFCSFCTRFLYHVGLLVLSL